MSEFTKRIKKNQFNKRSLDIICNVVVNNSDNNNTCDKKGASIT